MTDKTENSPRDRLISTATELFAKNGFAGTGVREICAAAEVSSNMIHHYFGSKQALYDLILSSFSDIALTVPARILAKRPENRENLMLLLEIFVEETFETLVKYSHLYEMVIREQMVFDAFAGYTKQLVEFLEQGKKDGLIRQELDVDMLTGMILDRVGNQILFAKWIIKTSGTDVLANPDYRKRWVKGNLDLIFHGILA